MFLFKHAYALFHQGNSIMDAQDYVDRWHQPKPIRETKQAVISVQRYHAMV